MKKILILVFLLLILSTSFIFLSLGDDCRTINLLKPKYSFKDQYIKICFSKYNFRTNIKDIIRNYPYLNNLTRKLERTLFSYTFKRNAYVSTQRYMHVPEIQKFDEEMPFIQGIINQVNTGLSVTETNTKESFFEYSNWHRSHGGN